MNISKKQSVENKLNLKFIYWDLITINNFLQTAIEEKQLNLKNYWLQKKEVKNHDKEHNAKLDKIARFVTKYISDRKSQEKG